MYFVRALNRPFFPSRAWLQTFHLAGSLIEGVTFGVPRLKELAGANVNISTPCVVLKVHPHVTREAATLFARQLGCTMFRDVLLSSELVYESDPLEVVEDTPWLARFADVFDHIDTDLSGLSGWVLDFELCPQRCTEAGITPGRVAEKLQKMVDKAGVAVCTFERDPRWRARVYLKFPPEHDLQTKIRKSMQDPRRSSKRQVTAVRSSTGVRDNKSLRATLGSRKRKRYIDLSDYDADEEVPIPLGVEYDGVGEGDETVGVVEAVLYSLATEMMNKCTETLVASGHACIKSAVVPTAGPVVVQIYGTKFEEVAYLYADTLDLTSLVTNNVMEAYRNYGVEAAHGILFHEFRRCFGAEGGRIDERYIALLCDYICMRGNVLAINRHGLNKIDTGFLARVSFEQSCDMLFDAAAAGEKDHLRGVSERIMLGVPINVGTGAVGLVDAQSGHEIPKGRAFGGEVGAGDDDDTAADDTMVVVSSVEEDGFGERVAQRFDTSCKNRPRSTNNVAAAGQVTSQTDAARGAAPRSIGFVPPLSHDIWNQKRLLPKTAAGDKPPPPPKMFRPSSPVMFVNDLDWYAANSGVGGQTAYRPPSPHMFEAVV